MGVTTDCIGSRLTLPKFHLATFQHWIKTVKSILWSFVEIMIKMRGFFVNYKHLFLGATFWLKKLSLSVISYYFQPEICCPKVLYFLCVISHLGKTWCSSDALYTWSSTITSLLVQACSLMPCRSRFKVYVLCLLILSAAHQSGSPLSCVGDVTINLPGILEENVWEGTCSKGVGVGGGFAELMIGGS